MGPIIHTKSLNQTWINHDDSIVGGGGGARVIPGSTEYQTLLPYKRKIYVFTFDKTQCEFSHD